MSCDYFEKPKDWGVAPKSQWVSGTPIGEIKMPALGDPGSHLDASSKASFGDDMPGMTKTYNGRPVKECPDGTGADPKSGICSPEHSDADPIKIAQAAAKRSAARQEETLRQGPKGKFKAPEGHQSLNVGRETATVEALSKQGAKARGARLS